MRRIETVKLKNLITTPLGEDLTRSEAMRPYMNRYRALLGKDSQALEAAEAVIKDLPLQQRYIWRVISALDWGLADFDSNTVKLDLPHISDDLKKEMAQKVEMGLIQLQILLDTLDPNR